ncbi:MAG TPA: phosphoribosyltransferase [Acidobacteriaceae bacterium]|nr:phosphoribosyltransferase [Acidobacteriaceae bacterium]
MIVIFQDRRHAGQALARLVHLESADDLASGDGIVLGLPRGGVPVAFEVARELRLPLDVFVVRKLGVPGQEELAMGAVASGGVIVLQKDVIAAYRIDQETIDKAVAREHLEIKRRENAFRQGRPPLDLRCHTIILVDDGLATGATMKAAVRALRPIARRMIVAIPVAASGTCEEVRKLVDRLICIECPEFFHAVGEFYRNFDQTTDDEVCSLLAQARQEQPIT